MKHKLLGILLIFFGVTLNAQQKDNDFKTIEINKTVREFPDKYDLSSPLNSYVYFKYLLSQGKQGLYRSANSYKIQSYFLNENSPDTFIKEEKKEDILNIKINKIIIYKDSVAGVLTDPSDKSGIPLPMQVIAILRLEDGEWLNAGEDLGDDMGNAQLKFINNAPMQLETIHQIGKLKEVSKDTASFVNYLKKNGSDPEQYILHSLAQHKIVIYGEVHRRKESWDLMRTVISNPKFAREVGTVFMELSSDKQLELDAFFHKKSLDKEIILNIFRDVQINGWYDKGMYEFLLELWAINNKLPFEKKIQVVAVDEPRPFRNFTTMEEMENHFNQNLERNDQMAQIILQTIKEKKDKRNNFFIVGLAHAYKTTILDMAIGSKEGKMKPTAASQLKLALSDDQVYSIFQHIPIISNNGHIYSKLRNGIFDYAFSTIGNKPVAFDLKNCPFGKEPFDALNEISYNKMAGKYEDNYDAYLFLGPLKTESDEYMFNDIITEDYFKELKRRAKMTNSSLEKWFDINDATMENIKNIHTFNPNNRRWRDL